MATVAAQNPGTAGALGTYAAASAGGDRVPPGTRLHVINGSGSSITLTIATPLVVDTLALADRTVTIPTGATPANAKFVDIPSYLYQDPADGLVGLAWSATTTVTFAVLGAQPS